MLKHYLYLGALASFLIPSGVLSAQVAGQLSGAVSDQTGAAVLGAKINLFIQGGSAPIAATQTNAQGLFTFSSIRPEHYALSVEASGFRKQTIQRVNVDPGRATVLPPVKLEVGSVSESIDVAETVQPVETSNAELSTTVTAEQVRRLPVLDRNPLSLIATQPNVTYNGRGGGTTINGQRVSFSNVTLDGINVQDNWIRTNALDLNPNRVNLDQIAEFTVATSNANSAAGGGAAQVVFVTPSGSNEYHGSLYWYNRNNSLAASDWFANQSRSSKPFLNQNQAGGSFGGPVIKNKLLFYTNYELLRKRQQMVVNRTILTGDARNGIFTYRDNQGAIRKVNVLEAAGEQVDPAIRQLLTAVPGPEKINNFNKGDSTPGLLRNTAGYSFNSAYNKDRDSVLGKVDYYLSSTQSFTGTFSRTPESTTRPTYANDYSAMPKVKSEGTASFLSAAWRWNPTAAFTNEARGGLNSAPVLFTSSEKFGNYLLGDLIFDNPVNTYVLPQGRYVDTYNYSDNATWTRGRHDVHFGVQAEQIRVETYDYYGTIPTYYLGIGSRPGLTEKQLPGIGPSDLANANKLLATLAGYLNYSTEYFNVTNRNSGFVPYKPSVRHLNLDNYAAYIQDNWKITPRLTLNLGLRYDLFRPVDEANSLYLMPKLIDNNPIKTLMSNATLDFSGASVGRPWYATDKNNFAPKIGLAYDLFGDGKTALRAGYSISYVNDEYLRTLDYMASTNQGLSTGARQLNLTGTVSSGMQPVPVPAFKMPLTFADNYSINRQSAVAVVDPNLRTPYVQQWNFGLQHDFDGTVVEVRYNGSHAVKQFRVFDFNQVVIRENGFLDDFLRAQSNGFLARKQTGVFNPAYNAAIAGSQPLTLFPLMYRAGYFTNGTVLNYLQTGQAGELANYYQYMGYNGPVNFYKNPYALGANYLTNYSNASYNALTIDVKRRMSKGVQIEGSYTYSKSLSDTAGDGQTRFEPFLDMANPSIERARTPFDLTHAIKANGIWDLPIGRGHRFNVRSLDKLLTGWSLSGILTWQSGAPFSVLSSRATVNRSGARSDSNTANTTLNKAQLDDVLQFRQTPNGPYFVAASIINPADGRAVAADGQPAFTGQVFFQPGAGELGVLQRRMFSGPWVFNLDAGVLKNTMLTERQSIEFRMEATNVFNHPSWFVGDQNIGSSQFGKITSLMYGPRVVQLGLYYRF